MSCCSPLLYHFLHPIRHGVVIFLDGCTMVLYHPLPCFFYHGEEELLFYFIRSGPLPNVYDSDFILQSAPEVLYGVEIRRASRPVETFNSFAVKVASHCDGGVHWRVVVHKYAVGMVFKVGNNIDLKDTSFVLLGPQSLVNFVKAEATVVTKTCPYTTADVT